MESVFASIDIGTDTIKIVVCELLDNKLNMLAATSAPSEGIKKGLIVDPTLTSKSIKKGLDDIEGMLGVKIDKLIATIPSYNALYKLAKSSLEINGEVKKTDISILEENIIKKNNLNDKEFLNIYPIDFLIDGKSYKYAIGKPCKNLTFRGMLGFVPKKSLYSVASILENMGIELTDVSVDGYSDIYTFKDDITSKGITAIVNIGHAKTTVTVYSKNIPVETKIIGQGGKDIEDEIAEKYNIKTSEARIIKEKFSLAYKKMANSSDKYGIIDKSGLKRKFNQAEVSEIVENKLRDLFENVKSVLKELSDKPLDEVILTGGTSNLIGIETLARSIFGRVIKGKINTIGVRNNKYSVALGNIVYFTNLLRIKGKEYTMLSEDDMEVLSSSSEKFLNTSNDSMLGKVVNYFFGE